MRVSGPRPSRHRSRSVSPTRVAPTPKRAKTLVNSEMVEPNTLCDMSTWSPARSSARPRLRIAPMPDAAATQRVPPSSAASRSSKARTVGLVKRE